jgi:2-polyprenyl-3-methyl-5-hydroxy-6-metoxy-1,4-benzoquinol methylase
MKSKITGGATTLLFKDTVLGKHTVSFYQCNDTGFIQTEKVYWLEEAYANAITNLDLGLVERNLNLGKTILPLLLKYFPNGNHFLDYGGGYGIFVRMMRDRGFDFYLYDTYCDNIFAKDLQLFSLEQRQFTAITAFEVMEHLDNPLETFEELFQHTDTIIFSTEIVPDQQFTSATDWWYFSPTTGQHIAFYTLKSLEFIARQHEATLYSNGSNLHIITKHSFTSDPFRYLKKLGRMETFLNSLRKKWFKLQNALYKKESLLGHDVNEAMKKK